MTREDLFAYVKTEYGVSPDFPWDEDFESAVLCHTDTKKWFGLAMFVRADKLGYPETEFLSILTLKCEPLLIDVLIQKPGYHRAYHMNKTQWMSIELDVVSDDEIKDMLDLSFRLSGEQKPQKFPIFKRFWYIWGGFHG